MMRSPKHSSSNKKNQEKFVYCEDTKSINKPDTLMLFDQCHMKERDGFQGVMDRVMELFDHVDEDREECQLRTKSDVRTGRVQDLPSRRFCLNEDYIQLTMEAFDKVADCFDYSDEDKKHMFKLISHESQFVLNKRGGTGDACYGQVTGIIHHELNRYIVYRDAVSTWVEEYNLYKNALNKEGCDFLSQKVVHFPGVRPEDVWTTDDRGNDVLRINVNEFDKRYNNSKKYSMFCRLTHDPYSCFFYSFYNYKINESTFIEGYNSSDNIVLSEDLMRDFHAPIRYNEMIVFRGDIITRGGHVKKDIELMFADHAEVRHYFVDTGESYSEDSQIYKVKVFPEDILQKDVVSRAYQGGKGVITRHWPNFMESLKRDISNANKQGKGVYSGYRRTLASNEALLEKQGNFLKAVDLDREFSKYLESQGRPQTSKYVSNMENDVCYYQDRYMKNLLEDRYHVRSGDRASIIQYVQEHCPSRTFETPCVKKRE